MNKLTRLKRRVLRDHRQTMGRHWTKDRQLGGYWIWRCPHCHQPGSVVSPRRSTVPPPYR